MDANRGRRAQRQSYRQVRPYRCALHRTTTTGCGIIVAPRTTPVQRGLGTAEVRMPILSARYFLCNLCRILVLICSHCDHGHQFCGAACAKAIRRARQREAGRRYQQSRKGRLKHAQRTARWRARRAALAQIVTHQGSPNTPADGVLTAGGVTSAPTQPLSVSASVSASVAASLPEPDSATTPTPTAVGCCHFCGKPCAALLRQGFLRRRRDTPTQFHFQPQPQPQPQPQFPTPPKPRPPYGHQP